MTPTPPILEAMLRKLETRAPLDAGDRAALLGLPYRLQILEPAAYMLREGERPTHCALVVSGFVFRHKLTVEGARQIVSVHIPGDFVDLSAALLNVADHNVQTLTRSEIALVPRGAIQALILSHPRVGAALWVDTLIDGSIFREWVVNVGRRDARSRLAHLLCEFARRLEAAGLAEEMQYELPMTQEQLADATGLTPVHVNRVLRGLEREGLITRARRFIGIPDWEESRRIAGFSEIYLHFDQLAPTDAREERVLRAG
ncbi:MAG TPA: Crp/Fnr family transcriptional regulator [Allosphingosinicella sp.]|nr:Crp/Fnr family transcriptional regulator [Allosphingosinicella sp.]